MSQAEYALIAAILVDCKTIEQLTDISDKHFADPINQSIFRVALKQYEEKKMFDTVTVFEGIPGIELSEIVERSQTQFSFYAVKRYEEILINEHLERRLSDLSYKIHSLAEERDKPIQSRIDEAQSELAALNVPADDGWVDAYQSAIEHSQLLQDRYDGHITGIPTMLHDLDEYLDGGLQRGNLFIIGARPAMGKSAIAMSIGLRIAQRYCVGFISLEMSHTDLRDRQAAILSGQTIAAIKRPKEKDLDFANVLDAVEQSRDLRWYATERSGLNIHQIKSMARSLKRKRGLDVLIVDYVGLMQGTDPRQPRTYQIEEATKGLKNLAKELQIAVICLAQVNRSVADRADQTPQLSDLRDSGAIEQDGDVIAFIHRPIQAKPDIGEQFENYALLRIAKNRQGRCGDVDLFYHGSTTNFSSWAGDRPTIKSQSTRSL